MIRFLQPEWFWAFAVLPLIILWRGRRGPVAAVEYSDVSLARDVARRTRSRIGGIVWLLPILAAAGMIVGLARPQRTHSRTEVTANGIDIVLGLDVSGSMQALDFAVNNYRVNRIAVVKSVVSKFIDERPNDRIGLIAFAASPYIVSPLTLDHDWLQQNLDRVNVGIGDDGTAIGSALAAAVNPIRTFSYINPSHCGYCDGSITLYGLNPNQLDSIYYTLNGVNKYISYFVGPDSTVVFQDLCDDSSYTSFYARTDSVCVTGILPGVTMNAPKIQDTFSYVIHYGCNGDTVNIY